MSSTQLNGGSGLHNLQTAKVIHNSSDLFTVTFILLLAVYIFYGIASSTPVLQSRYNFNGVAMTVFGLSQPIVLVFVGKILYETPTILLTLTNRKESVEAQLHFIYFRNTIQNNTM